MLLLKNVFVFIFPLLLLGCSTSNDYEYREIDGLVSYRSPVILPDAAILTVTLKDITDRSQPAIIIDELNREKVTLPVRFSFRVPRDEIIEGHINIIRAYVKYRDKLMFMNVNAVKLKFNSSEPMLIMLEKISE